MLIKDEDISSGGRRLQLKGLITVATYVHIMLLKFKWHCGSFNIFFQPDSVI